MDSLGVLLWSLLEWSEVDGEETLQEKEERDWVDDLIATFTYLAIFTVSLIILYRQLRGDFGGRGVRWRTEVHPENIELVEEARRRIAELRKERGEEVGSIEQNLENEEDNRKLEKNEDLEERKGEERKLEEIVGGEGSKKSPIKLEGNENDLESSEQINMEGRENGEENKENICDAEMENGLSNEIVENGERRVRVKYYGSQTECPICYNTDECSIETNCGHLFCAECILTYWKHGSWLGGISCPVCRQEVFVLLPYFSKHDSTLQSSNDPTDNEENVGNLPQPGVTPKLSRDDILEKISDYNKRFSGVPRPWMDYIYDCPVLLRHLFQDFFSVNGLMLMFRLRIFLCFLSALSYLCSPFDFLPDHTFGLFGLIDDVFVAALLIIYATVMYRHFLAGGGDD